MTLKIENYKSIKKIELQLPDICAFIGDNNTGKSVILDAVQLLIDVVKQPTNKLELIESHEVFAIKKSSRCPFVEIGFDMEKRHCSKFSLKIRRKKNTYFYEGDETPPYPYDLIYNTHVIDTNTQNREHIMESKGHRNFLFFSTHFPEELFGLSPENVFIVYKKDGFTQVKQASDMPNVSARYSAGDNMCALWRQGFLEIDRLITLCNFKNLRRFVHE